MSQFRSKKLDLSCFINARVIRDHTKRYAVIATAGFVSVLTHPRLLGKYSSSMRLKGNAQPLSKRESQPSWQLSTILVDNLFTCSTLIAAYDRQALRYIIRNTTLPQRARAQAQLQLSQMHCYTRFTQINNRCIEGGKSRGVLKDFRMARVCLFRHYITMIRH